MHVKYPRPGRLRLLFTDTDSLAYAVQTDDIYRDMAEDVANRSISASILSTITFMALRIA